MKAILSAVLILAAASAVARAPASGSWQVGDDSFHIHYADLDMTSAAGRAQLLARVEKAAARLCSEQTDWRGCVAGIVGDMANTHVRQALADREATRLAAR